MSFQSVHVPIVFLLFRYSVLYTWMVYGKERKSRSYKQKNFYIFVCDIFHARNKDFLKIWKFSEIQEKNVHSFPFPFLISQILCYCSQFFSTQNFDRFGELFDKLDYQMKFTNMKASFSLPIYHHLTRFNAQFIRSGISCFDILC